MNNVKNRIELMKHSFNFSFLLVFALLVSIKTYSYDFEVNGIFYNYDSYSQSAIVAPDNANGTKYFGEIVIPNTVTYKGRTMSVTAIGNSAFRNCRDLLSVLIPSSVVRIEAWAFRDCPNLRFLSIPNSVNYIGDYVFADSLVTLVFEDGQELLNIEKYTFNDYYPKAFYLGRNCNQGYGLGLTLANTLSIGKDVTSLPTPEAIPISSSSPLSTRFLNTIYTFSENPSAISGHFNNKHYLNSTLYVPKGTKDKYMAAEGWKNFFNIEEVDINKMWNGQGNPNADSQSKEKCERPTINYANGKLSFTCATEGAICQSTITDADISSFSGNEVQLTATYTVNVYATKAGYENSSVATATLCWIDVEPKTEGITNSVANISARALLVQTAGGTINVQGADDGDLINVYSINGIKAGSAVSQNGVANINTSLQPGTVAIIKVGQKSVKVVVK
jgi:hypothetical protein